MVREGFIEGPGGRTWYGVAGEGKPGIPLLILHGGPGAPHDYLEPLEALSDERPVVFYDQLGCGNSEIPEGMSFYTVEYFVEELGRVRSALSLTRVHILGQSWGAMLAAEYVGGAYPDGVASLILSAPCLSSPRFIADQRKYLLNFPEDIQKVIEASEASGDYSSPAYQDAVMAYYGKHVCRLDPWPECMKRTTAKFGQEVYNHMWGPSEFTMTGTLKDLDLTADLAALRLPVLLTAGEFDEATPAAVQGFASLIPDSEVLTLKNTSHMHHLENPEEYLKAVREFLARHDTTQ